MRITKIRWIVIVGGLTAVLAGCATTPRTPAPVVDRGPSSSAPQAAVSTPTGAGSYTVKKGDNLYRIALEHGQSSHDLVVWNQLSNANDIKVGQVLRVTPPGAAGGATVGNEVQVGSVGSGSGVDVRPLTAAPPSGSAGRGASTSASIKTGPLGSKKPYSEAALAEMQKPESSAGPAAISAPATAVTTAGAAIASGSTDADDANIGWIWPTEGKVVGNFDSGKKGIDIAGRSGQPVLAAGAGKVMYAGSGIRGYGNLVIVKHTSSLLSAYAHNKTILVKEGQTVSKGQKIAEMGNSDSDSVKLHFEIRRQGKPVDPAQFLPKH